MKRGYGFKMVRKRLLILIGFWLLLGTPFVWAQQLPFTLDFESGDLGGWKKSGNAFVFQPTKGDNPTARHRGQPSNHQGKYWIGTYEKYQGNQGQKRGDIQGDRLAGTLTSLSFTIPSGTLSFLVGGGSGFKTRVELLVLDPLEGSIRVKYASGRDTETMHRETWDLAPYAGKKGRIRIVDDSSGGWGHINVDDFQFSTIQFIQPPAIHIQPPIVPIYPEQKVEIPGLIGHPMHEAETMIDAAHLKVGEVAETASNRKPGTVIRQHPAAGNLVSRGTQVNLWIARKQEFPKPEAVIEPIAQRVKQGEISVFESRSVHDPDESIKEYWSGPDQKGEGHTFEVGTQHLMPGEYRIVLEIIDNHQQRDSASAILYVEPAPVVYRLTFKAEPTQIEANKRVRLTAVINPDAADAEYRFSFGDGEKTAWISKSQIGHHYTSPGTYLPSVETRIGEKSIVKRARIEVRPIEYSVGLRADRQHVQIGEDVRFEGGIRPIGKNVRYRFYYGDGERSGWLEEPTASHTYSRPGLQHAYLEAKVGEREFRSEKIPIDVRETEYSLQLEADPPLVQPEERIIVNAILEPFAPKARYQFDFGDGETHVEGSRPDAVHIYRAPGAYDISVTVTIGQRSLSKTIRVTVQEQQPPVHNQWPPLWILIAAAGGALAVIGGGAYLYCAKPWKSKVAKSTEVVVTIRTKEGQTNQEIDKESLQNGIEVLFRPVGDVGTQEIEQKDNIVGRERSDHE